MWFGTTCPPRGSPNIGRILHSLPPFLAPSTASHTIPGAEVRQPGIGAAAASCTDRYKYLVGWRQLLQGFYTAPAGFQGLRQGLNSVSPGGAVLHPGIGRGGGRGALASLGSPEPRTRVQSRVQIAPVSSGHSREPLPPLKRGGAAYLLKRQILNFWVPGRQGQNPCCSWLGQPEGTR